MSAKLRSVFAFGVALLGAGFVRAATQLPAPGQLAAVFRPFRVDQVALSPDGRHLAYTVHEGALLFVMIVDLDRPDQKATIMIGENATGMLGGGLFQRRVMLTVRVTSLRWITADKLIYATSVPNDEDRTLMRDELRLVDADGKNDHKLINGVDIEEMFVPPGGGERAPPALYIPRRLRVLGLTTDDPEAITVEALGGLEVKSELFKVSLATGKFQSMGEQEENGRYLYDRQGRPRILETPHFERPLAGGGGGRRGGMGRMAGMMMNQPHVVPQIYRYRPAEAKRGWEDLDHYLGKENAFVFRDTPENYYGQRSFPLAFDADPNLLYFASNIGRNTYGIYALDLRTKRRTDFAMENPAFDFVDPADAFAGSPLVFDREGRLAGVRLVGVIPQTRWVDQKLARLQRVIDGMLPGRNAEILDWDDSRTRLIVLATSTGNPGRYFVYQEGRPPRLTEFFRRAPWLAGEGQNATESFACDTPAGVHLTGMITRPFRSRITPAPLMLVCRELPGRRERSNFNREVEAFADMGFVVAQVNYRGVAGFGAQHRDAAKAGYDQIPIEDLRAAVKWIAANYPVNTRRVALIGDGFGGYLALRAVQLFPNEFRCAVSINAPAEPKDWLNEPAVGMRGQTVASWDFELRQAFFERSRVADIGLTKHASTLKRPVFIVQDTERRDLSESQGTSLRNALKKNGLDVEYLETTMEFSYGDPDVRAKVFAKIAEFLNDHVYDYGVDIGEAKEVK